MPSSKYPYREIRVTPEVFMGEVIYSWRIVMVLSSADDFDTLAGGTSYPDAGSACAAALSEWADPEGSGP